MTLKNTRQKPTPWYQRPTFLWSISIALIVFATFWPVLQNGFFNMDDLPLITRSRLLLQHSLLDVQEIFARQLWTPHYKPLVNISWMLERDLFGMDASVLHFNNMLLHVANALLVFFFIVRLLPLASTRVKRDIYLIAGFSAMLWAIHPLRVESVAWAVERKDVLFGLFYLLACHAWISHMTAEKKWKWLLLATLFYGLACLSKSMAITFPAVAFLLDFITKRAPRIVLWDKLPLLVVMLLMLFLYGYFGFGDSAREIDPLRTASAVPGAVSTLPAFIQHTLIANYRFLLFLGHTLMPVHLAVVYPREVFLETLGVGLYLLPVLTSFLLITAGMRKWRHSMFAYSLFWFIIVLSPILSGEGVGTNFMSDRYTYLPSIFIVLVFVTGVFSLSDRVMRPGSKPRLPGILALSLLALLFLTVSHKQSKVWRTNLSLWQQAIENYPGNWYALYNRAKLTSGDNLEKSLDDLQTAIDRMPGFPALHYARGTLLMQKDREQDAIADFDQVISKQPRNVDALINRGNCFRAIKRPQDAISDYTAALSINPKSWKALNNRGLAYGDMGKFVEAALDFDKAIKGNPDYVSPFLNRANLRLRPDVGNYAGAIEDFNAYLAAEPESHEALFRRGYARLRLGQATEALKDMDAAIRLYDREGFYYIGRAQVYETLGNTEASQRDLQKGRSLGAR